MNSQLPAVSPIPVDDYEEIEAAVMETSRGRAFLLEYARRLRAAETAQVLAALARLEQRIAAPQAVSNAAPDLREAVGLVQQRLLDIAASAQARGADARTIVEIETQARALGRLLPESARTQSAPTPERLIARPPMEAGPEPRAEPRAAPRDRAAAFAAIDAMDLRARASMFA